MLKQANSYEMRGYLPAFSVLNNQVKCQKVIFIVIDEKFFDITLKKIIKHSHACMLQPAGWK